MQALTNRRKPDRLAPVKDFSVLSGTPGTKQGDPEKQQKKRRSKNKYTDIDEKSAESEKYTQRVDKSWHLSLRSKDVHRPANGWRRHFTRGFQTFDHLKERLADKGFREEYENGETTPRAAMGSPDRMKGHWGGILGRDDEVNFTRSAGCEGANAGLWLHLLEKGKNRSQLAHHTTLREAYGDQSGARVNDNRTDGCIVEMMGKKKWCGTGPKSLDLKLHHLNFQKVAAEPDEENRKIRVAKTPRRDAAMCGPHYVTSPSPGGTSLGNSPSPRPETR